MPQGLAGLLRAPTSAQHPAYLSWLTVHPLLRDHMPSVYFPSPTWPCSFSLGPLPSSQDPKSVLVRPHVTHASMAPGQPFRTPWWVTMFSC